MRLCRRAVPAALLISLLSAGVAAADPKPDFDSRGDARLPAFSKVEKGTQADLGRDIGQTTGDGRIEATRTGVSITGLGDQLTGPSPDNQLGIALDYLRANSAALGLTAADIDALKLQDRYTDWSGVTHFTWTQVAGGIDSYDNQVRANVARDGSLINVGSTAIPDFSSDGSADISAGNALGIASRNVDATGAAPRAGTPSGRDQETHFSNGDSAKLTLFGTADGATLAWRVSVAGQDPDVYDVVVDADTGKVLKRADVIDYANATVWERSPGAPGDTPHTVDLSALGYLTDTGAGTYIAGPNSKAWSDTTDNCSVTSPTSVSAGCSGPSGSDETVPDDGSGNYVFPLQPFTGLSAGNNCPAIGCTWDPGTAFSWRTNREQNVVQAFYYVNQFHDHLLAPPIGFDKASHNFEVGGPGGDDPVLINADDGANFSGGLPDTAGANPHSNNANFATPSDGHTPVMQMYLFEPVTGASFRSVNGGDDGVIVYHEYTHGLSNRLLANGIGINGTQPGAMGEAWSDWYAFDYQVDQGRFTDTAAPGELDADAYVTANAHIVRTQPIDCPVGADASVCPGQRGAGPGGYTYGDFGKVVFGNEVHADGEIWGETLWDLRTAIGSAAAERIVTDALRISPTAAPTFTQQRDSIIAADLNAFNGSHLDAIWAVFAHRGMGWKASSSGSNSTTANEDFSLPSLFAHTTTAIDDSAPGGDGDGVAEPGETVKVTETLTNTASRTLSGDAATLTSTNAVVDDDTATSALDPNSVAANATTANASPFLVTIPSTNDCGAPVSLGMNLSSDQGAGSIAYTLPTGTPVGGTPIDTSKTETPALAIPDGTGATVDSSMPVAGAGRVGDIDLKLDSLTSRRASDVKVELIAPSGKVVTLINRVPFVGAAGTDFTNTVLDDETGNGTIGAVGSAPWTGTFKPQLGYGKLSDFDGEPIAGTWRLRLLDGGRTGSGADNSSELNTWSLHITPATCGTTVTDAAATTGAASGVDVTVATLNGTIDGHGTATSYRFDYGTSTSYGSRTTAADAGTGPTPVSSGVSGLAQNTTYHYRVVALRGSTVVARGADQTFTTLIPPSVAPPTGGGSTPPGGGTTNPPPPAPKAGFAFKTKSFTLDKKGQFTFTFTALKGLKGSSSFKSASKIALPKKKKAIVTVGSKSFTVDTKGSGKIKLKLSKALFSYVKKHKSLKVTVTLTPTSVSDKAAKTTITLKAPKKK